MSTGEERRPSTGSSLYHKVYSSSSSESGSDASESEEEDVPSESKEDAELAKTEMESKEDIEGNQEITPMVMESEQGTGNFHNISYDQLD